MVRAPMSTCKKTAVKCTAASSEEACRASFATKTLESAAFMLTNSNVLLRYCWRSKASTAPQTVANHHMPALNCCSRALKAAALQCCNKGATGCHAVADTPARLFQAGLKGCTPVTPEHGMQTTACSRQPASSPWVCLTNCRHCREMHVSLWDCVEKWRPQQCQFAAAHCSSRSGVQEKVGTGLASMHRSELQASRPAVS